MARHPAEVFGHALRDISRQAQINRRKHWCPFVDCECRKQSRLIAYPMGVCSVRYGEETVALCPRRFLQNMTVFKDIAQHHFDTENDIVVFSEIGLSHVGTFDYVMVKHKPLSSDIEDFAVIELQTAQTTGTGQLVKALTDYVGGKDIEGETYSFGLNLADIWKRTFTQVLNKGIVLEHWGHNIYWIVQVPVYQDFVRRYNLDSLGYDHRHNIVFATYDLRRQGRKYELFQTGIQSSTTDDLFEAFKNNPDIPSRDAFVQKLEIKLRGGMEFELQLREGRRKPGRKR